jgi:hypothetical protein
MSKTLMLGIWIKLIGRPRTLPRMQILLVVHTLLKAIHTFTSLNLNIVNSLAKLLHRTEVLINHQPIAKDLQGHLPNLEPAVLLITSQLHHRLDTLRVSRKATVIQLTRGTPALGRAIIKTDRMTLTSTD